MPTFSPLLPLLTSLTFALLALICIRLLWQKHAAQRRRCEAVARMQQRIRDRKAPPRHYRAVSIQPARPACKLSRRYQERRFLAAEAPRLPLAGCRVEPCRCRYQHHDDRRSEERRNPFGIDHVPIGIERNRRGADRRRLPAMNA